LGSNRSPRPYSERAKRIAGWKAGLWTVEIHQHHIGVFLHSFKDDFTTVWGDIEIANVEVGRKVGQLPLGTRLRVDKPEILC